MIQIPQKWNRFSDQALDKHLDDIYAWMRQSSSGSEGGTDLETNNFFIDVYYSGGYLSTETYYSTSARSTKLRDYTYTYSSGLLTKMVENIYNLGMKVQTNTTTISYNGDDTIKSITQSVS